jgi:putative membrane protein
MYLTEDQRRSIVTHCEALEANTGVEVLVAVVGKCDCYPEIPWKAFALGAAAGAQLDLLQWLWHPIWSASWATMAHVAFVLGLGALAALATIFWPGFARLFLDRGRSESETRQYAQAFFLERDLARTSARTALLVLVGVFERQVVILPDRGVARRLTADALASAIAPMTDPLRRGDHFQALLAGVTHLAALLREAGFQAPEGRTDQIPDELVQLKGEAR